MRKICYFIGKIIIFINRILDYFVKNVQKQSMRRCGSNVYIGKKCIFTEKNMVVGNNVYIGAYAVFQATHSKIIIGDNVMVGPCVHIHGGNHRFDVVG